MQWACIITTDEPVSLCFSESQCYKILSYCQSLQKEKDRSWICTELSSSESRTRKGSSSSQKSCNRVVACGSSSVGCSHGVSAPSGWLPLCSAALPSSPHTHVFFLGNYFISLAGRCWCGSEDHAQESLNPIDSMDTGQFPPLALAPGCGLWRQHQHRHWHQVSALRIHTRYVFAFSLLSELAFPSLWKVQDGKGCHRSKGLWKHPTSFAISDSGRFPLTGKSQAIDFPYGNASK